MTDQLYTIKEAAKILRVSPGKLRGGWGPAPHPAYTRPVMYHRDAIMEFLGQWREMDQKASNEAGSSSGEASTTSGSASTGESISDQRARQIIAERKLQRSA